MNDLMKEWEDKEIRESQQPRLVRFPREIYRTIRSWFYLLPDIPRKIKWNYQVLTKGYCDCDIWNLNDFIIKKVRKPLKEFVRYQEEKGHSLPGDFERDPAGWLVVLSKMEYAFDHAYRDDYEEGYYELVIKPMTDEQRTDHYKKINEGMELFGKYLLTLWD